MLLIAVLLLPRGARAHEGPPFPILVDQKVDNYVVSVWTDPDVGTGLFFVIFGSEVSQDVQVQIGVQPVSGRLPEAFYTGVRENLQDQIQYRTEVQFDAEELWRVRVRLISPLGTSETSTTVEVTPPGYGRWDLLIYLMPFVAIGILWMLAMTRKLRRRGDTHG